VFFFLGTVLSADKWCGAGSPALKQIPALAAWSLVCPSPQASLAVPARNAAFWTFSLANLLLLSCSTYGASSYSSVQACWAPWG